MAEHIQAVDVWPGLLRLLHGMLAVCVLILLVTGSLMQSDMILSEQLYQHLLTVWHLPAGHVLSVILLVRIVLLVSRRDIYGWKALIPDRLEGVIQTAIFYVSLARMQLPNYFAHNPLWKALYLLFYILLAIQVFTGLMLESSWLRSVFRTDSLSVSDFHEGVFGLLLVWTLFHVITALLHDWKSPCGETSAMINGRKFFTVESGDGANVKPAVTVSLDSLAGNRHKSGQ